MAPPDDSSPRQPPDDVARPEFGHGWRPQMFSHVVSNSDQVERLNAEGGIAVNFAEHSGNPVHLAFDGGQSRTLCIWATSSRHGFKSTPKIFANLFTLRFVTGGSMIRNNFHAGPVVSRDYYGTFVGFEDMRDERASADFSAITATVSQATLAEASLTLSGEETYEAIRLDPFVELKTDGLRALRLTLISLHRWLQKGSHDLDLIAPMLEELVVYQLIGAWPKLDGANLADRLASQHALRKSIEYMMENLSNRITMKDIAGASGVGLRALQLAFKREFGCSPIKYLIDRRLDRVHAALQTSEGLTIRAIAAQWGFVHMSDFTQRYHKRFGYLPSALNRG